MATWRGRVEFSLWTHLKMTSKIVNAEFQIFYFKSSKHSHKFMSDTNMKLSPHISQENILKRKLSRSMYLSRKTSITPHSALSKEHRTSISPRNPLHANHILMPSPTFIILMFDSAELLKRCLANWHTYQHSIHWYETRLVYTWKICRVGVVPHFDTTITVVFMSGALACNGVDCDVWCYRRCRQQVEAILTKSSRLRGW